MGERLRETDSRLALMLGPNDELRRRAQPSASQGGAGPPPFMRGNSLASESTSLQVRVLWRGARPLSLKVHRAESLPQV